MKSKHSPRLLKTWGVECLRLALIEIGLHPQPCWCLPGVGVVISGQMHCRPRPIAPAPRDRPHRRHSDQAFDASHKSFCRQCNGLKRVENLLSLDFVIVLRDEVGVVKLLQLAQAFSQPLWGSSRSRCGGILQAEQGGKDIAQGAAVLRHVGPLVVR